MEKTMNGRGFRAKLQVPASFLTSFRSDLHVVLIVLTNGVHDGEKLCLSVALRPQKPSGLLGTGSPGRPSDFYKAPEL